MTGGPEFVQKMPQAPQIRMSRAEEIIVTLFKVYPSQVLGLYRIGVRWSKSCTSGTSFFCGTKEAAIISYICSNKALLFFIYMC